jgi:TolA-binding protein
MGYLNSFLAAIFCATAPFASATAVEAKGTEETRSAYTLGKERVAKIRAAYEKGQYDEFLAKMDREYKAGDLDGLIQMRQREVPVAFQEKWEQQFLDLQKQKNRDLMNVVSDKDDSIFAEKVRSLAANISTPEQEKGISKLHSLLLMAPKTGANEDENKLIDIDLEYEYKLLHAALPTDDVSPEERSDYQIALRMEKMDQMKEAAKYFQDHSLKTAVGLAAANLDLRLARNLDGADLNALAKGKVKPSTQLEESVYLILSSYQEQFNELMKQLDQ